MRKLQLAIFVGRNLCLMMDGRELLADSHGKACMQPLELLTPDGKLTGNNGFYDLIIEKSVRYSSDESQNNAGFNRFTYDDMSEDCLFLNIVVPKGGSTNKPVMFWIMEELQGGDLGMKVITQVNIFPQRRCHCGEYKLSTGSFCLVGSSRIIKRVRKNVSGNYGTLDQIAALKWVKDNMQILVEIKQHNHFGESVGDKL